MRKVPSLHSRSRTDLGLESPSYTNSCPFVSIRGSSRPPAIIRENPCQSVAKGNIRGTAPACVASRLRVRSTARKVPSLHSCSRTDLGLESPSYTNSCPFVSIRGSNRPTAIIRVNPCQSVAKEIIRGTAPAFSASSDIYSPQSSEAAQPQPDRSRAGKPELHEFVRIRVHSWFKLFRCDNP